MKEGSTAPTERINITYKPATGDMKEEIELPLRLLVMGDFTSREEGGPLEKKEPVSINKDTFDQVLKSKNLSLQFSVPNPSAEKEGEEATQLPIDLRFESLNDFEPDQIIAQVQELRQLAELRSAIASLKGPLANIPEFRQRIKELVDNKEKRDLLLQELGLQEPGIDK